jgi:hypothetical protein
MITRLLLTKKGELYVVRKIESGWTTDNVYLENLLIFKRRQYLVYKFLRDVIKEPVVSDKRLKEIGKHIIELQERLHSIQDMLPYADYFQGGKIKNYPDDVQAKAFMILGQIKGVEWHVLAMEHGVYVKGSAVRVGDW